MGQLLGERHRCCRAGDDAVALRVAMVAAALAQERPPSRGGGGIGHMLVTATRSSASDAKYRGIDRESERTSHIERATTSSTALHVSHLTFDTIRTRFELRFVCVMI